MHLTYQYADAIPDKRLAYLLKNEFNLKKVAPDTWQGAYIKDTAPPDWQPPNPHTEADRDAVMASLRALVASEGPSLADHSLGLPRGTLLAYTLGLYLPPEHLKKICEHADVPVVSHDELNPISLADILRDRPEYKPRQRGRPKKFDPSAD